MQKVERCCCSKLHKGNWKRYKLKIQIILKSTISNLALNSPTPLNTSWIETSLRMSDWTFIFTTILLLCPKWTSIVRQLSECLYQCWTATCSVPNVQLHKSPNFCTRIVLQNEHWFESIWFLHFLPRHTELASDILATFVNLQYFCRFLLNYMTTQKSVCSFVEFLLVERSLSGVSRGVDI